MASTQEPTRDHALEHLGDEMVELLALTSVNAEAPALETLSGDALADLVADADDPARRGAYAHLARCQPCRDRWQARAIDIRLTRDELESLVDEAFDDAALERQREGILARLAARRDGGRVLSFPLRDARPAPRERPAIRWLAAAAAAGLLVGVAAGQQFRGLSPSLSRDLFGRGHEAASRLAPRATSWLPESGATADLRPVHAHDELFLSEMETALNNRGVAELRALDDLTPRAPAER
jgi:hypothetical protein